MSRITNDRAAKIAKELTAAKRAKLDKKRNAFIGRVVAQHWNGVPEQVRQAWNDPTLRPYIKSATSVNLNDGGGRIGWTSLSQQIPFTDSHQVTLNPKMAKEWLDLEKAKSDLDRRRRSVENTLCELRTYKRIGEAFPEAAPYLQNEPKYLPAVNVESLRKELNDDSVL